MYIIYDKDPNQACLSIYTELAGGFYFREFAQLSLLQLGLCVIGIGLTVLGLAVPLIIVNSAGKSPTEGSSAEEVRREAEDIFECMSPRSQSPPKGLFGGSSGLELIDLDLGGDCIKVEDEEQLRAGDTLGDPAQEGMEEPAEDTPMMQRSHVRSMRAADSGSFSYGSTIDR